MQEKEVREKEIPEVSCGELKQMIDSNVDFTLIDVRNPEEFESSRLNKSVLVPYSEIQDHLGDFDKTKEYVVHCKLGGTSTEAVKLMMENGFENVKVLSGGLVKWSVDVDSNLDT